MSASVSAREADAQCRGSDLSVANVGHARGRALHSEGPQGAADIPVGLPVLREAARQVAVRAATSEAHGRSGAEPFTTDPSIELLRLLAHLRATVTHYAGERRDAGVVIERLLPEVKGLVREAAAAEGWSDPSGALVAQVVRWTITGYYDQPEQAHAPRFC